MCVPFALRLTITLCFVDTFIFSFNKDPWWSYTVLQYLSPATATLSGSTATKLPLGFFMTVVLK